MTRRRRAPRPRRRPRRPRRRRRRRRSPRATDPRRAPPARWRDPGTEFDDGNPVRGVRPILG
ncbi:hypothetical protein AEQ27_08820 [Frigoribacterium sp. RIT-PI-h]|nr:hypothetical protein AEQ27_08820 [Frigoribacterium sp. RIT-PI-h]